MRSSNLASTTPLTTHGRQLAPTPQRNRGLGVDVACGCQTSDPNPEILISRQPAPVSCFTLHSSLSSKTFHDLAQFLGFESKARLRRPSASKPSSGLLVASGSSTSYSPKLHPSPPHNHHACLSRCQFLPAVPGPASGSPAAAGAEIKQAQTRRTVVGLIAPSTGVSLQQNTATRPSHNQPIHSHLDITSMVSLCRHQPTPQLHRSGDFIPSPVLLVPGITLAACLRHSVMCVTREIVRSGGSSAPIPSAKHSAGSASFLA
jgi:hypothetical protein